MARHPWITLLMAATSQGQISTAQLPVTDCARCLFEHRHPRRYPAFYAPLGAIDVDGRLDEPAWQVIDWTEPFTDIQGAHHQPGPYFRTQVKMRYNEHYLYVAAYLEETAIWANETEHNSVVFHDNDFEVFIDADGSTHSYKELEINALNVTWNLLLNKPYRNGGHENSTRVDPHWGVDMTRHGLKTAVFMEGHPNDPRQRLHFWTIEIALPLAELARFSRAEVPPRPHSFWRINFSRVEWHTRAVHGQYEKIPGLKEENWVWSPQGAIAMHMPERWGYLEFRDPEEHAHVNATTRRDPDWGLRWLAFQFYYAQDAYHKTHNCYASTLDELAPFVADAEHVMGCFGHVQVRVLNCTFQYEALVTSRSQLARERMALIRSDSYLLVDSREFLRAYWGDQALA